MTNINNSLNKGLTLNQKFEGFKQIDYTILNKDMLKKLYDVMMFEFLKEDSETNSYYFNTGIKEFDDLLEEFDNYYLSLKESAQDLINSIPKDTDILLSDTTKGKYQYLLLYLIF